MHKYLGLSTKSKQTEESGRMKSACQCEQRQGTTCFRKQTVNVTRWIFHRRAKLMRGSRGVLPRDCIVIHWTVPPLTASLRETSESLAPIHTCAPWSEKIIPTWDPFQTGIQHPPLARYMEGCLKVQRYTFDSGASLPNFTIS